MSRADDGPRTALALAALACGLTLVRLWIAARIGLSPDEAYYWTWSRDLALVYRDHPPLVAWAIALGTSVVDGEIGVRLPAILCGAAAVPATYLVASAVGLGRGAAFLAAGLGAVLPAPAAGALISTPDSLLGLAWLLGGLALARLAKGCDPRHWIALGTALGVGLLAKHSAALLAVSAGALLLFVPATRAALKTRHPWLGLGVAALIASPYFIAEIAAGAPSLSLQLDHLRGALSPGGPVTASVIAERFGGLAGGQLGLLTPPVALLFALSFGRASAARGPLRAVQVAALVPLAAAALAAFGAHPEQNWASLGHPFFAVAAVAAVEARFCGHSRAIWRAVAAGTAIAASAVVHVHAVSPFLPLPPARDPVSRLHGYGGLRAVERYKGGVATIVCDNYGLASELAWTRRDAPAGPAIASADRLPSAALPAGRWLLLDESGDYAERGVEGVPCAARRKIAAIPLRRADGAIVRTVDVYACDPISATLPPA
ncbi:MAG: glycosyltransferase family 39 protein [Proteobacteria bacterium]|nr:glycosyltransferase family 39 protein [Pseudomonadota bacterium]